MNKTPRCDLAFERGRCRVVVEPGGGIKGYARIRASTRSDTHPLLSYRDFAIKLEFDEQSGLKGRFEARVSCRLTGDLGKPERRIADLTPFGPLLEKLNKPHMGRSDLVDDLGERLSRLLFPGKVKELFGAAYRKLTVSEALRVRVECLGESISSLPWEYTSIDVADVAPGQLALNPRVSIVRHEALDSKPPSPRWRSELVVVSLDASVVPGDTPLPPDSLRPPPSLGKLRVRHDAVPVPTREGLRRTLRGQRVDIFHFWGHGEASEGPSSPAGLVLQYEDDDGADILTGPELTAMLRKAGVSLAVLSGCHTGSRGPRNDSGGGLAQALVESGVPIVVAMQHPVGATQAAAFNKVFYDSLFNGETVDQAVSRGRQGIADYGSPVLYHRSDSGAFLAPITTDPERTDHGEEPPPVKPPSVVRPKDPIDAEADAEPAELAGSWSQLTGRAGSWRIESGTSRGALHWLRHALEALQGPTDDRMIAVSPDCGSVVQWTRGNCAVAWINRIKPRLVPWPRPFAPLDEDGASLLASTTAGADEVKVVLTTSTRTYEVRLSQRDPAAVETLVAQPSRAAVYLGSTPCTVDAHGQIRDNLLRRKLPQLAEVIAVDAARSGGDTLVGALGLVPGGKTPVLVAVSDAGYPHQEPLAGPATGLVVVRQLDPSAAPDCIVTAAGTTVSAYKITEGRGSMT